MKNRREKWRHWAEWLKEKWRCYQWVLVLAASLGITLTDFRVWDDLIVPVAREVKAASREVGSWHLWDGLVVPITSGVRNWWRDWGRIEDVWYRESLVRPRPDLDLGVATDARHRELQRMFRAWWRGQLQVFHNEARGKSWRGPMDLSEREKAWLEREAWLEKKAEEFRETDGRGPWVLWKGRYNWPKLFAGAILLISLVLPSRVGTHGWQWNMRFWKILLYWVVSSMSRQVLIWWFWLHP